MKSDSPQEPPPRRRSKRPRPQVPIRIDESSYDWIRDPSDREAVRAAILRTVEAKHGQATLDTVVVRNQADAGHLKAVITWRGLLPISGDDLDYIRDGTDRIEDAVVSHGDRNTAITVLVKAGGLAPSVQSDNAEYRPRKKAKT